MWKFGYTKDKVLFKGHTPVLRIFTVIGVGWAIVIASLLTWDVVNIKRQTTSITLSQARSFFKQVITVRYWNAMQGGVYVPVTEKNKPNPYLEVPERDIKTKKGRLLTLINPAYMTRQIAEIASKRDQVQFHITSLNPIRLGNAPAQWEIEALKSFLSEKEKYYKWEIDKKAKRSFRYMAPLWVERPCLKCHEKKGYSEGDLRGGISVIIPADSILASRDKHIKFTIFAYLSIWILGMAGIAVSFRSIKSAIDQRESLAKQLQNTLKEEVKTLRGFIPICSSCKKIRNDKGYWEQIEKYITTRSEAEFTHSICPDCAKRLYPEF